MLLLWRWLGKSVKFNYWVILIKISRNVDSTSRIELIFGELIVWSNEFFTKPALFYESSHRAQNSEFWPIWINFWVFTLVLPFSSKQIIFKFKWVTELSSKALLNTVPSLMSGKEKCLPEKPRTKSEFSFA